MPSTQLVKNQVSLSKNGVGGFIIQCRKMVFHYCEKGGSSRGMTEYVKGGLFKFAKENPEIEIVVKPRPSKHPCIRGIYLNNRDKVICVKNKTSEQIEEYAHLIRDSSGLSTRTRFKKPVVSTTESVRGIWSPFHTKKHVI
ncbi:hypothetical protein G9A89_010395 [Geosiphon pyriformis]|nr:hypothetical protein G9A89_010395 [Geosiphon pyriformis]